MKEIKKIGAYLIFLYLAFFPLGQIIRFDVPLLGRNVPLNITDVIAFISLLVFFFLKYKDLPLGSQLRNFAFVSVFSLFFSLIFFRPQEIILGSLYLLRFLSYFGLYALTWNLIEEQKISKDWLFKALFIIVSAVSILGWIQYLLLPDIRDLAVWGWDDHLYRLVGSFLDPTFTGIILVFGFLIGLSIYLKEERSRSEKKIVLVLLAVILSAIAYTYSRASYFALAVGVTYLGLLVKKVRLSLLILLLFSALVFFLPRPGSEGVILERTKSVVARFESYKEGLEIFKKSPIFGIGFNNICLAKTKFLDTQNKNSHSCSGLDSSLLFILATTGVVGFLVFVNLGWKLYKNTYKNIYGYTLKAVLVSLLVHSFFSNSIFYPWVLGFVFILTALTRE